MTKSIQNLLFAGFVTSLLPSVTFAGITEENKPLRAGALEWKDISGRKYGAANLATKKATLFIFSSTKCPISNLYIPRIIRISNEFAPKGVQVFLVNSNTAEKAEKVASYAKARKLPFPAVKDNCTALADKLQAHVTPEAVIVDSTGTVRYRGRIDDNKDPEKVARRDVAEALGAILSGSKVPNPRTLPFGCAIFRDKPAVANSATPTVAITYGSHVAKILSENCVVCHRAGEVAPFSLETYQQARAWAAQIKDYTSRRIMPPWKAVPGYGEFHDSRYLTNGQISALSRWADAGAPQGNAKVALGVQPTSTPVGWTLGKPDLVIQPDRDYHLEAEGRDVYRNYVLPVDFSEDRLVTGMEFKPGNRSIVHHIVTYIDPTGACVKMDCKEKEPGYTVPGVGIGIINAIWGEVWVPGNAARFLPPGVATKIPKGAKLVMQVHYHKTGKPEVDRSQMALYYAKGRVERMINTWMMGDMFFELKPGESRNTLHSELSIPTDVHLHSIFPHMHMLGKEMKIVAHLPDGSEKKLIYINDWDFNWQATYFYKESQVLPKGTRIELTAVYDNSEGNPHQTSNPPKAVRFGEQTTDEMCFCFLGLTVDKPGVSVSGRNTVQSGAAP
jgi:hypothetical protein